MKPGLSLQRKILLASLGYTSILILSMLIYYLSTGRSTIQQHAYRELRALHFFYSEQYSDELSGVQSELKGLQSQLEITSLRHRQGGDPNELFAPVEHFLMAYPEKYASITVFDPNLPVSYQLQPIIELGEMGIRRESVATPTSSHIQGFHVSGPAMGAFGPILTADIEENGRVLSSKIYLSELLDKILSKSPLADNIKLFFADSAGLIIHASDPLVLSRPITELFPSIHMEASYRESISPLFYENNSGIYGSAQLARSNLLLVIECDLKDEYRNWRSSLLRLSAFSILVFVIAFLVIHSVVRKLVLSLAHVTRVACNVAEGDFSQKLDVNRTDELGILFQAFNDMTDKLKSSYDHLQAVNLELEENISELKRTRMELTQKQRLAVVGEAISKISHEIQNKIGGVSIWIQNLERLVDRESPAQEALIELKKAMRSFMEMLVQFKRFYRAPSLVLKTIPCGQLVDGAILLVQPELDSRQIKILREIDENMELHLDADQMTGALVNLLLNAIYYTPEKGTIRLQSQINENQFILSVRDEGPGVPEEILGNIFHPFFTTKAGGSGLGLAITQNIIQAHQGSISVINEKDGGASFIVTLPINP